VKLPDPTKRRYI